MRQHFDKAKLIWQKFVPKDGQADTIQGELLRAVEKLRWEAQNNNNLNWDKDFEYFIDLLGKHLLSEKSFDDTVKSRISKDLKRLSDYNFPVIDDDIYDRLSDRVAEWYDANPGENKLEKKTDLNR